jgi:hypothetical protein
MNNRRFAIIALSFGLFHNSVKAASAPVEFADIPWKSPVVEAKRLMTQRDGVTIKEESAERIICHGGTFAGQPAERWELIFTGNQFCEGAVYLVFPRGEATQHLAPQFEALQKMLTTKYGKGTTTGSITHYLQSEWTWAVSDPKTGRKETASPPVGTLANSK